MAQIQADSVQDLPPVSIGTMVNLAGGLVSIALLVGVVVWGYRTMARDVSEVPVVRASQDPMRVAPEDPGGTLAGNMGLAVNKVAAEGVAEKPADRLILAPEPIALTTEDESTRDLDKMVAAERRAAEMASAALTSFNGGGPEKVMPTAAQDTAGVTGEGSAMDQLTAMLLKDAAPLSDEAVASVSTDSTIAQALLKAQSVAGEESDSAATEEVADADTPETVQPVAFRPTGEVPTAVIRPRMRPGANSTSGPLAMIAAPMPLQPSVDVDPTTIPVGTRLAQLGAYDSVDVARKEWDRFSTRFADYMSGKQRVIQQASSGGRTFYRLRVMGFDDLAAARYFCAALVAENTDCIPVVAK